MAQSKAELLDTNTKLNGIAATIKQETTVEPIDPADLLQYIETYTGIDSVIWNMQI